MSAAQLEARRKAGLSTSNPTHACSGAISNAKPDCEEKRDPDKRSLIIQKKENELDPDTQLEKRSFARRSAMMVLKLQLVAIAFGGKMSHSPHNFFPTEKYIGYVMDVLHQQRIQS
ncbi:hypothetical protein [Pacificibacter marinus]|uniref:hypothetical protein n=1 Tax=Pacificibacter marinus TaxID=658057 RepID=UPI000B812953|nr:hypothetical protein [Pacificibacter marinus]